MEVIKEYESFEDGLNRMFKPPNGIDVSSEFKAKAWLMMETYGQVAVDYKRGLCAVTEEELVKLINEYDGKS